MKCVLILAVHFLIISKAYSMASIKGFFSQDQSPTEAGTCIDCLTNSSFQGRPLSAIDMNYAAGEGGTFSEAKDHYELFIKNNPGCLSSSGKNYGMITNLSNGTASNLTYIVEIDSAKKVKIVDIFQTGEGVGVSNFEVSNQCDSLAAPHGFMKMGDSDFRPATDRLDPITGNIMRSDWPLCGDKNPNFTHNRILLHGLERGYNDNLSEKNVSDNPNNPILCRGSGGAQPRYARLHSISYNTGNTTQGCKGFPLDKWCKWAPLLKGGCAYNYDGSETPTIKKLKGTAAPATGSSNYLGS